MLNKGILETKSRNPLMLVAAFAAIYILWGSTYVAIKFAIETLPSFMLAGSRFLIAGAILMTWARFSKEYEKPTAVHWKTSLIVGTLLLLGGNGGVVFAQHYISSSLAALLVATEPFWIVIMSWLWLKGTRPSLKTVLGIAVGFFGVWLLINGQPTSGGFNTGSMQFLGALVVIGSALAWATGSIYGLRAPVPKSSLQSAGMQMLSGGAVLMVVSLLTGEFSSFDFAQVSSKSLLSVGYLIVAGSLVGFTAYSWLLKNSNPALVSTYAYVNPIVAVFLGWLIAGESFTGQMLIGAAVIVGSVVLITAKDHGGTSGRDEEIHKSITPGNCKTASATT